MSISDMQSEELLHILKERLSLSQAHLEECSALYDKCWSILESDSKVPASLLQGESSEEVWRPCLLWLIKSLCCNAVPESQQTRSGFPLSEMLNACKVSLISFFRELPIVVNKVKPTLAEAVGGADSLETVLQLREWQETLVSLQHISNKYKDLFWYIQRNSSSSPRQPLMRAGWLMFLLIKAELLPGFPDLVSCLELLVCVLNVLLASTPFNESQLKAMQSANPAAIDTTGRFNTLKALSQEAKVDYSKTKALMPQIEARFRALLEDGQFSWVPVPLPEQISHPQAAAVDTCCGLYLDCLGGGGRPEQIGELVLTLDQSYNKFLMAQGEIDERDFLLSDFGALASPRAAATAVPAEAAFASANLAAPAMPAGGSAGSSATAGGSAPAQMQATKPPLAPGAVHIRNRGGMANLGLQSPMPLMQLGLPGPATPITQAMGSVNWLRGIAKEISLEPSVSLTRYMTAAGADAGRVLVERIQAAAEAVFLPEKVTSAAGAGGGSGLVKQVPDLQRHVAQERSEEGIKLYWHVLEAMLVSEEARSGLTGASQLLLRWSFHQCLLACAFELVAASYRMGALSFPAIPAKLNLKPFDLSKMIGPFVRAEPTLPRELKRHMFTVEEKILESLGWAAGSSFYQLARAAAGQPAADGASGATQQQQSSDSSKHQQDGKQQDADMQEVASSGTNEQQQQQGSLDGVAADVAAAAGEQLQHAELEQKLVQQIKDDGSDAAAAAAAAATSSRKRTTQEASDAAAGTGAAGVAPKRQCSDAAATSPSAAAAAVAEDLPLPRALGPPGAAAAGSDPAALAVLHDYCKRVLKLAAFRLVAVSELLDFSPMDRDEVVAAAHDVLTNALYKHTHLFYGRHLDTLLLASLYGYCKVKGLQQITFREIISHYKRQSHAKQEVFRTVVLKQTDPSLITQTTGDIIAFYNAVFVPAMKNYLLAAAGQTSNGAANSAGQQHNGQSPSVAPDAAARAATTDHLNSPVATALMLAAQQQQQRGWAALGSSAAQGLVSPGSAYRALSLAGNGGGTSTPNIIAGLNMGLGQVPGSSAGFAQHDFAAGLLPAANCVNSLSPQGPGVCNWGGLMGAGSAANASWGDEAAAAVAAAAAAMPMGRPASGKTAIMTSIGMAASVPMPSRLSRSSRLADGGAAAAVLQQQAGDASAMGKTLAGVMVQQQQQVLAAAYAAVDAAQQQDQSRAVAPAAAASSEQRTGTPETDVDAGNMDCDDSAAAEDYDGSSGEGGGSSGDAGGSSGSFSRARSGSGSPRAYHDDNGAAAAAGHVAPGDIQAGVCQSPAGLTTLMRALDTSNNPGMELKRPSVDGSAPAAASIQTAAG